MSALRMLSSYPIPKVLVSASLPPALMPKVLQRSYRDEGFGQFPNGDVSD